MLEAALSFPALDVIFKLYEVLTHASWVHNIPARIVNSLVRIKMGLVIVTLKIMPESPDVDLAAVEGSVKEKVIAFVGETKMELEVEPIAFGLKALNITFAYDEDKGSPDEVEASLKEIEGVQSCECVGVRRALG